MIVHQRAKKARTHTTLHANWKRNETIQNMTNNNSPCSFLCMFAHLWWYAIEWLTRSSQKVVVAMAIKRLLMILLPFIQPDDCFRSILHEICRKLVVFSHCCFCSFLVHVFFFGCVSKLRRSAPKTYQHHAINIQALKESKESMWNE